MARSCVVALVQAPPATGSDPVGALADEVTALCTQHPGVSMIVYPEIHLFGGSDLAPDANDWLADAAEPIPGPRTEVLSEIARRHRVWLLPGSLPEREVTGDGAAIYNTAVYNTAVVFDPDGRLVASYRKVFPWRPYEAWTPGSSWVTFAVPDVGRFGLSICYDSWFPESTRQLGWLGADVVLNIVKTVGADRAQELVLARANAIVNQVYFLSLNAAGPVGAGRSIYVDPDGDVLVEVPDAEPTVTILELDLDRVRQIRDHGTAGLNRLWQQSRPDDAPIPLPAYDGAIRPDHWAPPFPTTRSES